MGAHMKDKRRNVSPETKRNNPRSPEGNFVDDLYDPDLFMVNYKNAVEETSNAVQGFSENAKEAMKQFDSFAYFGGGRLAGKATAMRGEGVEFTILDEFAEEDLTTRVRASSEPLSRRQRKKAQIQAMLKAGMEAREQRALELIRAKEREERGWGTF